MRPFLSKMAKIVRPRRRWFQYSLRTLLLLVLIVAIGMSWFTVRMQRAKRQKEAVDAIVQLEGGVVYDYEQNAPQWPAEPPGPQWLHRLVGRDFLADVVSVSADGPEVGGSATITDADMVHFAALADLEYLDLSAQAQVTDLGVAHLSRLKKLETLYLIGDTKVTDAGLFHLRRLRNLQTLDLFRAKVGDAGLAHLKELPSLRGVHLMSTEITDMGLAHLGQLTRIERICLSRTKVTDAGLAHLEGLANLKLLELYHTQVTDDGVEKLQQALPNCKIKRSGRAGPGPVGRAMQQALPNCKIER